MLYSYIDLLGMDLSATNHVCFRLLGFLGPDSRMVL